MISTRQAALTILTASALAFGLAPGAAAAPSGDTSAQHVVDGLERNGYKVILNKVGTAPLDECVVTAVRPGREVTELNTSGHDLEVVTKYTTIYVDAKC